MHCGLLIDGVVASETVLTTRTSRSSEANKAGATHRCDLSIVESSRRLKIPVRDYLGVVLPGLAGTPELTPAAWAARNN
jgi:hypothetical protein